MKVSFDIDNEKFTEIQDYNEDELSVIAKQLFIEWYRDKFYQANLHDRICDVVKASLLPTIDDMQANYKELFGLSKISQKKGEIMENNVFDMFRTYLPDYAITPTNHLPHHGDAEVVTPSNIKFLLEIKNYTNAVDQKEINKLKYDMKENNINYGLFISVKSGISGKKTIDYEHFDSNHIVYISYVSDVSKIYCGLLLLDIIARNGVPVEKEDEIAIKVREGLEEMTSVLGIFTATKEKFMALEKTIKQNLDEYYVYLRDQEVQLKDKINEIFGHITNEIEKIKIDVMPKDKHQLVMQRTIDVLHDNGVEMVKKDDTSWDLKKGDVVLGELKKRKVGVDVLWKTPSIEMRMTNTDSAYKMIEEMVKLA